MAGFRPNWDAGDRPFPDRTPVSLSEWTDHYAGLGSEAALHFGLTSREPDSNQLFEIRPRNDSVNLLDVDEDDFSLSQDFDSAISIHKQSFPIIRPFFFHVFGVHGWSLTKRTDIFTSIPGHAQRVSRDFLPSYVFPHPALPSRLPFIPFPT